MSAWNKSARLNLSGAAILGGAQRSRTVKFWNGLVLEGFGFGRFGFGKAPVCFCGGTGARTPEAFGGAQRSRL